MSFWSKASQLFGLKPTRSIPQTDTEDPIPSAEPRFDTNYTPPPDPRMFRTKTFDRREFHDFLQSHNLEAYDGEGIRTRDSKVPVGIMSPGKEGVHILYEANVLTTDLYKEVQNQANISYSPASPPQGMNTSHPPALPIAAQQDTFQTLSSQGAVVPPPVESQTESQIKSIPQDRFTGFLTAIQGKPGVKGTIISTVDGRELGTFKNRDGITEITTTEPHAINLLEVLEKHRPKNNVAEQQQSEPRHIAQALTPEKVAAYKPAKARVL